MALRNLAARMRNPAAAALRLPPPAPRVSPPAAVRPRFYRSFSFQGRAAYSEEDVRRLYQQNLEILDGAKKHEEYLMKRVRLLEAGRIILKWSFMLLMPIPAMGTVLKVTTH